MRAIPYQAYTPFEIAAIIELMPSRVARNDSEELIFFGVWNRRTLTLPRYQTSSDVNLEQCASEGVEVLYMPCGRAFLNTEKEVYFAVISQKEPGVPNVVQNYSVVMDKVLSGLRSVGVKAKSTSRIGEDGQSHGKDIKLDIPSRSPFYFQNMLAALAAQDHSKVFVRHGAIFFDAYSSSDVDQMLRLMNTPKGFDIEKAIDQISAFSSPVSKNTAATRDQLCTAIAKAFDADFGKWTDSEWSLIQSRARELELRTKNPKYYEDLPSAKPRGLCLANWGQSYNYTEE